jgi:MFS family permease
MAGAELTRDRSILRDAIYRRFWLSRAASTLSFQMAAVAIGWQVYELSHSTFSLGLVGLVEFLPILLLTLLVGHVADRFDRRKIMGICQAVAGITMAALALGSGLHRVTTLGIYCAAAVVGMARAFERPATQALLPSVVKVEQVAQAIAWSSSATQTAGILGPAFGGLLYGFGAQAPYWVCAALYAAAALLSWWIKPARTIVRKPDSTTESLFSGIHYIRDRKQILGAISLDLFVVLLGGATALLPAYARDILRTGPWGLGLLRLAPAVGALTISVVLAKYPIRGRAGRKMFAAVVVFGLATIAFALSRSFLLSMGILFVLGAADVVSVVVRSSLVQLETPDSMRGRVSAVNSLFIGTSNQLGQFESGVTASWWGVVPATVVGGVGSIAVALVWMWIFPGLRKLDQVSAVE